MIWFWSFLKTCGPFESRSGCPKPVYPHICTRLSSDHGMRIGWPVRRRWRLREPALPHPWGRFCQFWTCFLPQRVEDETWTLARPNRHVLFCLIAGSRQRWLKFALGTFYLLRCLPSLRIALASCSTWKAWYGLMTSPFEASCIVFFLQLLRAQSRR